MLRVIQPLGMNHIRNLKQEALYMWKDHHMLPELWFDCVNGVLTKHRLDMEKQFNRGDKEEQEKNRGTEEERRLELEAEEQLQRMRDAEFAFNHDADE